MSYRIAIAGAGIGGLALALLLARDGHDVTLFERFAAPRPLGSGLVIEPVGLAVLDRLGAGDDARRLSSPIARMLGQAARGRKALDVSYPAGAPGRGIHRATLFGLLWNRVQALGLSVLTGAEAVAAPQDGAGRRLALADGRNPGPFDLVVDASGAGSRLSPLKARPLGHGAIWGTVPWPETDLPRDQLRQRYRAASRMAGVLPIGRLPTEATPRAAVFWSMPAPNWTPGRNAISWPGRPRPSPSGHSWRPSWTASATMRR